MKLYFYKQLDNKQIEQLVTRTSFNLDKINATVANIIADVKHNGDKALDKYNQQFDNQPYTVINVADKLTTIPALNANLVKATKQAIANISSYHNNQINTEATVATMPGVECFRKTVAIDKVGLYIPGGKTPLLSTLIMLAIPAQIAGCKQIVVCSPPPISDNLIVVANLCNIDKIYAVGGAQAIAAMAFGTETLPKSDKIFGPGNSFVTAAKMQVRQQGAAIDLEAGPSEVLVIADDNANHSFVAADLLAQLEHGADSQAVLVCNSQQFYDKTMQQVEKQLQVLPRAAIIAKSIANSYAVITDNIEQSIAFSNEYAPEHLILNVENAESYINAITNAGSVFLGAYSCEAAGDYATGPNHTLPTYGFAKTTSGLCLDSFSKKISFQKVTKQGAVNIAPTVTTLASAEQLDAHKNAMQIRIEN